MIINKYNKGGGSTPSSAATYAASAGTSTSAQFIYASSVFPVNPNTGDVAAIADVPTRGTKGLLRSSSPELGVYQYDGSEWNKLGEGGDAPVPDFTILKSAVNFEGEYPEGWEEGEVFASHFAEYDSDEGVWRKGSGLYQITDSEELETGLKVVEASISYIQDELSSEDVQIVAFRDDNENDVEVDFFKNTFVFEGNSYTYDTTDFEDWVSSTSGLFDVKIAYGFVYMRYDPDSVSAYYDTDFRGISEEDDIYTEPTVTKFATEDYVDEAIAAIPSPSTPSVKVLERNTSIPSNLYIGDVFPLFTYPTQRQIGGNWTDSGEQNITYDRYGEGNPQAIRIEMGEGQYAEVRWAINDWDTAQGFFIGQGQLQATNPQEGDWTENGGEFVFSNADWMERTGGATVRVFHDGTYIYIYTTDPSKIWVYGAQMNFTGYNVEEGTVTPAQPASQKVFQFAGNDVQAETLVHAWASNQVGDAAYGSDHFVAEIYSYPERYQAAQMEVGGSIFKIFVSEGVQIEDEYQDAVLKAEFGDSGVVDLKGDWDYAFYEDPTDGIIKFDLASKDSADFTFITDYANTTITPIYKELARAEDIPEKDKLLPEGEPNYGLILRYDDKPRWVSPTEITALQLINIEADEGYPTVLTRTDYQDFRWKKIEGDVLYPKTSLPAQSEDGAVYAKSSYGIVQAQSGSNQTTWAAGSTDITGFTQFRFPADQYGYVGEFYTGTEAANLWWHGEDPNDLHFDGDNIDLSGQNGGNFTSQDANGTSVVAVNDGTWVTITLGAPVTTLNYVENAEFYATVFAAHYSNVVMSDEITRIKKLTQAEYDLIANPDPNTLYIIA